MKWPGRDAETIALPHPAPCLGEQAWLSKKEDKSQAAGLACAVPEIGAELSELGPARRILVLAWIPFLCSDDGFKIADRSSSAKMANRPEQDQTSGK